MVSMFRLFTFRKKIKVSLFLYLRQRSNQIITVRFTTTESKFSCDSN